MSLDDVTRHCFGAYHQGQSNIFQKNAGKQCTCMALTALIHFQEKSLNDWTGCDLNQILLRGNSLYSHVSQSANKEYLLMSELPNHIQYNCGLYLITIGEEYNGVMKHGCAVSGVSYELEQALTLLFQKTNTMLLTLGSGFGYTCAIMYDGHEYWVFDSHARNKNGLPSQKGKSVLLVAQTLRKLCRYLFSFAQAVSSSAISFELTAVQIQLMATKSTNHEVPLIGESIKNESNSHNFDVASHLTKTASKQNQYCASQIALNATQLISEVQTKVCDDRNATRIETNLCDTRVANASLFNGESHGEVQHCKLSFEKYEKEKNKTITIANDQCQMNNATACLEQSSNSGCNGSNSQTKIVNGVNIDQQTNHNNNVSRDQVERIGSPITDVKNIDDRTITAK